MGALHKGHISLIERAKKENNICVSSIFVNPLQFNDKKDLEKYPRTIESDIEKLNEAKCDILFDPSIDEMYPAGEKKSFDLSGFKGAEIMEGKHRPGHFQGVCTVVKKLFDIIESDKAYFGEKDFQQLVIIKYMVKKLNLPVKIIPCPTVREADGLAMSSRNMLLGIEERKNAPLIFQTLIKAKELKNKTNIEELKEIVQEKINSSLFLKLEYFEIVNSETLLPVVSLREKGNLRACIAVKAGNVRLIDNVPF
jgi:pantoate--beta-alanine ligase